MHGTTRHVTLRIYIVGSRQSSLNQLAESTVTEYTEQYMAVTDFSSRKEAD